MILNWLNCNTCKSSQLYNRRFDSSGVNALSDMFTIMMKLRVILLRFSNICDVGCIAIANASVNGAMAQLQKLWLGGNQIGDVGCTALADACAKGALPKLEKLFLNENQIGDSGCTALADACAMGSMASLMTLFVDNTEHLALKAVCKAGGIALY